jgi:hypothetical protein
MLSICEHERSTTLIDSAALLCISEMTTRTALLFELDAYYQTSGIHRCCTQITQLELLTKGNDLVALLRGDVGKFEYNLLLLREHKVIEGLWTRLPSYGRLSFSLKHDGDLRSPIELCHDVEGSLHNLKSYYATCPCQPFHMLRETTMCLFVTYICRMVRNHYVTSSG